MKNTKGEIAGIVEETTTYSYLGLQMSRSGGWKLSEQSKLEKLRMRAGMIKAKAMCLPQRIAPAKIMWEMAAKPQFEYGLECVNTSATWHAKADIIQNKLAKWLMEASSGASSTGALGEMGWTSMSFGIKVRKIMLWGRIKQLPEKRLVKMFMMMMKEARYRSTWIETIEHIKAEYQIQEDMFNDNNWKKEVRKKMTKMEWEKWRSRAQEKETLTFYRKVNAAGPEPYLSEDKKSKAFCQARIGDVYKLAGIRHTDSLVRCPVCNKELPNMTLHIIQLCKEVAPLRTWQAKSESPPWIKCQRALNNAQAQHIQAVGHLILEWKGKRTDMKHQ